MEVAILLVAMLGAVIVLIGLYAVSMRLDSIALWLFAIMGSTERIADSLEHENPPPSDKGRLIIEGPVTDR